MKISKRLPVLVAAAGLLAAMSLPTRAQAQDDAAAIAIGGKDIGGVVTSPQGREAGVWVIAETTELPTQFRRIVVTDDQGHYLVPDLPQADYSLWVRGYGLVDSPKMRAKPGQRLDLAAAPAPSAADAAHYYPAIYWYSPCCTDRSLAARNGRYIWDPVPDRGSSSCHSKRTKIAVITSRSSGTE